MRKQLFFLLSSTIICMSIVCMEQKQLISLHSEIICKIMNNTDLPSIGRFKQTNKKFSSNDTKSEYHIIKFICSTTIDNNNECFSPLCSQLKQNYQQCSSVLTYLAKTPENKTIFQHLYAFNKPQRNKELQIMTSHAFLTPENKMELYAGTYVDPNKTIKQNNLDLLTNAIYNRFYNLASLYIKPANDNVNIIKGYQKVLYYAIRFHHIKGVEKLLKNDAHINGVHEDGNTPLHTAAEYDHFDIVNVLIENGADIHKADENGNTLLHKASWDNHIDTVELLIQNNADINAVNKKGNTPLHDAAICGRIEIVKLLIKNNADINAVNKDRETPLSAATKYRQWHIVDLLQKKIAKITVEKSNKNYRLVRNGIILSGTIGIIYLLYKTFSAE